MAIGSGELMHDCFPKQSQMGTARMKEDNDTDEDCKRRREYGESKAGTKERSPDRLSLPNENTILIIIKWYYFKGYGKNTMKFNYKKRNGLE